MTKFNWWVAGVGFVFVVIVLSVLSWVVLTVSSVEQDVNELSASIKEGSKRLDAVEKETWRVGQRMDGMDARMTNYIYDFNEFRRMVFDWKRDVTGMPSSIRR